jgi:hemerythrin-like domain-containing protein
MPSALATLRQEHQRMLAAATAAETLAAQIEQGGTVAVEKLQAAVEFFSLFAHRIHRDKEEDHLFPALRNVGVRDTSCIGPLLADHEEAVSAFSTMRQSSAECSAGNAGAARQWAQAARIYCARMRYHVRREELVLVNAERLLSPDDQQELAEEFAVIDGKAHRSGIAERIETAERILTRVSTP